MGHNSTCEENYDMFFGETLEDQNNRSTHENSPLDLKNFIIST